jgi:hypothetical protein
MTRPTEHMQVSPAAVTTSGTVADVIDLQLPRRSAVATATFLPEDLTADARPARAHPAGALPSPLRVQIAPARSHQPSASRLEAPPQARHHLALRGGSTRRSQSRSAARTKAACETPTSSASRARCAATSGCSWITSFLVSRAALTLGSRVTFMRAASRLGQGNGARRDRFGSAGTAGRGRVSRKSETFLWARAIRRSPVLSPCAFLSPPRPPRVRLFFAGQWTMVMAIPDLVPRVHPPVHQSLSSPK